MDMVPYNPSGSRSKAGSRYTTSASPESYYGPASSYSGSSRSSKPSSSSSKHSSKHHPTSSRRAPSTVSTAFIAQTFGTRDKEGYTPGQPPADWYYREQSRQEWQTARRLNDGTRVRTHSSYSIESGYSSPSISSRSRSGDSSTLSQRQDRRIDNPTFSVETSPARYDQGELEYEETLVPSDSISQVSSGRSRRERREERRDVRYWDDEVDDRKKVENRRPRVEYRVVEMRPEWA